MLAKRIARAPAIGQSLAAEPDSGQQQRGKGRLAPYYSEFVSNPAASVAAASRAPFEAAMRLLVEQLQPEIVSFHLGLPDPALLSRVKAAGCLVMLSATIVREAIWLEENGADIIIAQGAEAGGHRVMFLTDNIAEPPGTFAGAGRERAGAAEPAFGLKARGCSAKAGSAIWRAAFPPGRPI